MTKNGAAANRVCCRCPLVYLAMLTRPSGEDIKVAVKTVRLAASEDDKGDFIAEAEVMLKLSHSGLCSIHGVAMQRRPWLCVIEFMEYGDLRDVIQVGALATALCHPSPPMQLCKGTR